MSNINVQLSLRYIAFPNLYQATVITIDVIYNTSARNIVFIIYLLTNIIYLFMRNDSKYLEKTPFFYGFGLKLVNEKFDMKNYLKINLIHKKFSKICVGRSTYNIFLYDSLFLQKFVLKFSVKL